MPTHPCRLIIARVRLSSGEVRLGSSRCTMRSTKVNDASGTQYDALQRRG
jgi:hypothetical protein